MPVIYVNVASLCVCSPWYFLPQHEPICVKRKMSALYIPVHCSILRGTVTPTFVSSTHPWFVYHTLYKFDGIWQHLIDSMNLKIRTIAHTSHAVSVLIFLNVIAAQYLASAVLSSLTLTFRSCKYVHLFGVQAHSCNYGAAAE